MLACPAWTNIRHKSYKLQTTARSYNVTTSHERQILHTTKGHPSTYNDKSIINSDCFYKDVKDGTLLKNKNFTLFEYDSNKNIMEAHYNGGWLMVDNGYLDWSCTIPPMKRSLSYKFIRFSEWLESMRKNVECTFGIMKRRFGILKSGIRLFEVESCDELFLTCCALHNLLLFHDDNDEWDLENNDNICSSFNNNFALSRLENPGIENNTSRGKSQRIDEKLTAKDNYNIKNATVNGTRVILKLSFETFYKLLVQHFHIRFEKKSIQWPKNFKIVPKEI